MRIRKTTLAALCLAFVSVVAYAAAGDRYFSNPTSNKDVIIQANRAGVNTDAIKVTGATGVVTVGVSGDRTAHTIFGNSLTLNDVFNAGSSTLNLRTKSSGGSTETYQITVDATDNSNKGMYLSVPQGKLFFTGTAGATTGSVTGAGLWTLGPATGAVGHILQGGNTQLNVKSNTAASSAYVTFAASGAGQTAIVGACSANALIGDAAEGDMCLRTGNDIRFSTNSGGSSAGRVSGTVWYNAAGNWSVSSDKRLKKNIVTMDGALARINALHPVTFDWIEDKPTGKPRAGFIAQEVEQTFPGLVRKSPYTYTKDGQALTLKDAKHLDLGSEMFANLVQAIQELSAENEALKFRLTALEADRKY